MIRVCPIIARTWWRLKTFVWPWANQDNRPPAVPKMGEVEDMLRTAIFDFTNEVERLRK